MNSLVLPPTFNKNGVPSVFGAFDPKADDLGAGIVTGYAVVGYRGKTWSIKYKGDDEPVLRDDGTGDPMSTLEVVILKAANHLSKTWYENTWSEGSVAAPDCASFNGVTPDVGVPKKQNDFCQPCKWNAFGSRPAQPGQAQTFRGKACSDNKRMAIVPLSNFRNELYGGPMLLRIPPASLGDVETFANGLKQIGWPYYAIGIGISFDLKESFPKFVFKPVRPLTQEEGAVIMELRALDLVDRIINGEPHAPATAEAKIEPPKDNVVAMQSKPTPKVNGTVETKPVPEDKETGVKEFDTSLDKKLDGLLGS